MYDDDAFRVTAPSARTARSGPTAYHPVRFPTKNISSPVVLIYGDQDSLVDINLMVKELPEGRTVLKCLPVRCLAFLFTNLRLMFFCRDTNIWIFCGETRFIKP
jgi:hypothetical protein